MKHQFEQQDEEREHYLAHLDGRPGRDGLVAELEKAREERANLPGANPCRNRRGEAPKAFPDGGGLVARKVDQRPVCHRLPHEEIVDVEAVRARGEAVRNIRLVDEEATRHHGQLAPSYLQRERTTQAEPDFQHSAMDVLRRGDTRAKEARHAELRDAMQSKRLGIDRAAVLKLVVFKLDFLHLSCRSLRFIVPDYGLESNPFEAYMLLQL